MRQNEPDSTELASVANDMSGTAAGVVQAGVIHGNVSVTVRTGGPSPDNSTPRFQITCQPHGDDGMFLWLTLVGPSTLDRVDEITLRVLDDQRRAPSGIVGGPTAEEITAVVWGPWRFPPGLDNIGEYGRTATVAHPLEMGERTRLFMERTLPPKWNTDLRWWRRDYANAALRLLIMCRRDEVEWRVPVDLVVEDDDQQADATPTDARSDTSLLALQIEELRALAAQRDRHAEEQRREQAAMVTIRLDRYIDTLEPPSTHHRVTISNASPIPVYGLQLTWSAESALWGSDTLEHLMPGAQAQFERIVAGVGEWSLDVGLDPTVDFTDAAGVRWRRRLGGELIELATDA
jgi:hypothetical protein